MVRELRAIYRNSGCSNWAGSKGIEEGREELLETVTGGSFGLEVEEGVGADTRAPVVSEMRGGEGYRFGRGFLGRGLDLELGQIVSPGAFIYLFCFLLFSFFVFFLFPF
jgi:hypothetical protein